MTINSESGSVTAVLQLSIFLFCIFASIQTSLSYGRPNIRTRGNLVKKPQINSMFKPSRLCPSYTSDSGEPPFRYHRETKRCYMVGDRGPCPDLMEFAMEDDVYGTCDCDQSRLCGRPLLYWAKTQRCYFVNDQGPCAPGKWLVFGFDLRPICKTNRCLKEYTEDPSRERRFWYYHQGKCYKTYTQGYCKDGQILFNNWREYRPTCNKEAVCRDMPVVHAMSCVPGSKKDHQGLCKHNYVYRD